MFCPNCGANCGNNRFCSECGTQLRQDTASQKLPTQDIPKRTNTQRGSTDIPTNSSYIGERKTYLDLNELSVTVSPTLGYKYRTEIPFDQLVTVIYLRPSSNGWRDGVLLFRGEENKDVPIPDVRRMCDDNAAVIVSLEKDTVFYHIFQMLKVLAPPTARFEMIIPETKIKKLEDMAQGIDLDYFWNMYAPFRERAASGIHAKYEIPKEAARILVDREFDARQKILYDADPLDAIRDLNLVWTNTRRETEIKDRQEAEIRKKREQEELSRNVAHIALMMTLDDK